MAKSYLGAFGLMDIPIAFATNCLSSGNLQLTRVIDMFNLDQKGCKDSLNITNINNDYYPCESTPVCQNYLSQAQSYVSCSSLMVFPEATVTFATRELDTKKTNFVDLTVTISIPSGVSVGYSWEPYAPIVPVAYFGSQEGMLDVLLDLGSNVDTVVTRFGMDSNGFFSQDGLEQSTQAAFMVFNWNSIQTNTTQSISMSDPVSFPSTVSWTDATFTPGQVVYHYGGYALGNLINANGTDPLDGGTLTSTWTQTNVGTPNPSFTSTLRIANVIKNDLSDTDDVSTRVSENTVRLAITVLQNSGVVTSVSSLAPILRLGNAVIQWNNVDHTSILMTVTMFWYQEISSDAATVYLTRWDTNSGPFFNLDNPRFLFFPFTFSKFSFFFLY